MNATNRVLIGLALSAATSLVHAARMEDVMDIPKPDIQEARDDRSAADLPARVEGTRLDTGGEEAHQPRTRPIQPQQAPRGAPSRPASVLPLDRSGR